MTKAAVRHEQPPSSRRRSRELKSASALGDVNYRVIVPETAITKRPPSQRAWSCATVCRLVSDNVAVPPENDPLATLPEV